MKIRNNMQLGDTETAQYFCDINDFITSLSPQYCTQDIVDNMLLEIQQVSEKRYMRFFMNYEVELNKTTTISRISNYFGRR